MFQGQDVGDITKLLKNPGQENLNEVIRLTYDELKKIANSFFTGKESGNTIQPTILVHEAFMKLHKKDGLEFKSRGHFYSLLGTIMRHVLIDHFREKNMEKRGGLISEVTLVTGFGKEIMQWDLFGLNSALEDLEKKAPRKAKVVELKFFAGATHPEIAEVLGVSLATIERDWLFSRAWLHKELNKT